MNYIKKSKLSMEEAMDIIGLLTVDEFETPRVQAAINVRSEFVIALMQKILSYYPPVEAMKILTLLAIWTFKENPELLKDMQTQNLPDEKAYIK